MTTGVGQDDPAVDAGDSAVDPLRATPSAPPASTGRTPNHTARWSAVAVAVLLVAFVVLLATRPDSGERQSSNPLVGRGVPPVVGSTLDGERFDIDDLRGRWVVVNFFATWCTPCKVEHPELVEFVARHGGDVESSSPSEEVSVVSVAFDDEAAEVRRFFDEQGGDWPVIVEGTGGIALDFGVTGVPESYLVAPNQIVVARFEGVTADGLDAAVASFTDAAANAGSDGEGG